MPLTYLGSLSVGAIAPSVGATIGVSLPVLQAQLDGLAAAVVQLTAAPPTIAASLTLAQALVTNITAAISLGVQVPTLSVQLAAIASAVATISAEVAILLSYQVALGSAGIHAYAFAGQANALGPAIPSSFPGGGPTDAVNALLLVTAVPASWTALGVVLKTS